MQSDLDFLNSLPAPSSSSSSPNPTSSTSHPPLSSLSLPPVPPATTSSSSKVSNTPPPNPEEGEEDDTEAELELEREGEGEGGEDEPDLSDADVSKLLQQLEEAETAAGGIEGRLDDLLGTLDGMLDALGKVGGGHAAAGSNGTSGGDGEKSITVVDKES